MGRRNRRDKRKQFYNRILLLIILISFLFLITKGILARYSSKGSSNAEIEVAYYLLKEGTISDQVALQDMEPRSQPYIYNFSVANYNGTDRTETALKYTIALRMTTNLPLEYSLYINDSTINLFENSSTQRDVDATDGMWFKTITSEEMTLGYEQNEINNYRLEVKFPENYNSAEYQGVVEALEIKIDSQQKI